MKALTEQELRFHLTRSCIERRVIDQSHGRRLLIVSCSGRKHHSRAKRKAWDLYDGVAYRSLKKAKRDHQFARDIDMMILSAKYGLISPARRIGWYNRRMNRQRSAELRQQVTSRLKQIMSKTHYREVLLWMGKDYLAALGPSDGWNQSNAKVKASGGRIGEKLRHLKTWISK